MGVYIYMGTYTCMPTTAKVRRGGNASGSALRRPPPPPLPPSLPAPLVPGRPHLEPPQHLVQPVDLALQPAKQPAGTNTMQFCIRVASLCIDDCKARSCSKCLVPPRGHAPAYLPACLYMHATRDTRALNPEPLTTAPQPTASAEQIHVTSAPRICRWSGLRRGGRAWASECASLTALGDRQQPPRPHNPRTPPHAARATHPPTRMTLMSRSRDTSLRRLPSREASRAPLRLCRRSTSTSWSRPDWLRRACTHARKGGDDDE